MFSQSKTKWIKVIINISRLRLYKIRTAEGQFQPWKQPWWFCVKNIDFYTKGGSSSQHHLSTKCLLTSKNTKYLQRLEEWSLPHLINFCRFAKMQKLPNASPNCRGKDPNCSGVFSRKQTKTHCVTHWSSLPKHCLHQPTSQKRCSSSVMSQHHTPNTQHSYPKQQRKKKTVRANQWATQRTTDQHVSCSSKTGALLELKAWNAHISIPSSVASSFKGDELNMDVRTGSVICYIQRSAGTHTSLDPATGPGVKRDTPGISNKLRKGQKMVTSLFYGKSKSRNKSTSSQTQTYKFSRPSTNLNRGQFRSGVRPLNNNNNKLHYTTLNPDGQP